MSVGPEKSLTQCIIMLDATFLKGHFPISLQLLVQTDICGMITFMKKIV